MPIRIGMSCICLRCAVPATNRFAFPTHLRLIAPCASRSVLRSIVETVALVLVVSVALVPRTSGAQATVSAHARLHAVRAVVGTVTHTAFLSHQRLTAEQVKLLLPPGYAAQSGRAWISTVDLRGNVNGVLLLEPRTAATGSAKWLVMNADGQLVPWTSQAIGISRTLPAGRHTVSFVWVAPDTASAPPEAALRVQPSP